MTRKKAGRPPGGTKEAMLSVRISKETRSAIETAARKNKRRFSAEVEALLDYALRRKRQRESDVYALVELIADFIEGAEETTDRHWRTDVWTNKAVLAGISYLARLEPGTDGVPDRVERIAAGLPEEHRKQYRDPVLFGTNAAVVLERMIANVDQPHSAHSAPAWRLWKLHRDLQSTRKKERKS